MAPAEPGDPEVQRWQEWLARPRGAEGPYDIAGRLVEAFEPLHDAAGSGRQLSATEVARVSVDLTAATYRIHPFVDGNTRATWVLLDTVLHKFGHPEVTTFPGGWLLARARSYAIRPDAQRSPEPLTALIAKRIARRDDE